MRDPVIFIGMHRSGTSLLGQLLERLGLFFGRNKDENNEALFFLELNTWMMAQCGARWDQPDPIADLWKEPAKPVFDVSLEYVDYLMRSPRAIRYLGLPRYLRARSIPALDVPWGWKDPRNTYTLPFWLTLFPSARVIFIERHGVDVAQSLRTRARKTIEITRRKYQLAKSIAWLRPKKGGFCESPRCLSLEGGFSLWEAYQSQAQRQLAELPKEQVLRVRYEDLLAHPQPILEKAVSFCGLTVNPEKIEDITASINSERAYSYRNSSELIGFAEERQRRLEAWGF